MSVYGKNTAAIADQKSHFWKAQDCPMEPGLEASH